MSATLVPATLGDSWASSPAVRKSMLGNKGRDTKPELGLRRELHRRGLRYRVNVTVPGLPRRRMDISWSGLKVAVFVDGCFWHGCPQHSHGTRANSDYWRSKIDRNQKRDRDTDRFLTGEGWMVLRFWEHVPPTEAADVIERALLHRRQQSGIGV